MSDKLVTRQSQGSLEKVVVRNFQLPLAEATALQAAMASNLQAVAQVAANGGVQGIRWISAAKNAQRAGARK